MLQGIYDIGDAFKDLHEKVQITGSILIWIIGILAVFKLIQLTQAISKPIENPIQIQRAAEDYVRAKIKTPSSATFSSEAEIVHRGIKKVRVRSWVDYQTPLGSMVRSRFEVIVEPRTAMTYHCSNLNMFPWTKSWKEIDKI